MSEIKVRRIFLEGTHFSTRDGGLYLFGSTINGKYYEIMLGRMPGWWVAGVIKTMTKILAGGIRADRAEHRRHRELLAQSWRDTKEAMTESPHAPD